MGRIVCSLLFVILVSLPTNPQAPAAGTANKKVQDKPSYNNLISLGYDLLKEGQLKEAYLSALEAAKSDSKRFESYALAALVLYQQSNLAEAKTFLEKALERAPEGKKAKLDEIARMIEQASATPAKKSPSEPAKLSSDGRRKLDVLTLILEEADKAATSTQRNKLLQEFLTESAAFVVENPCEASVSILRATAALELDYREVGWLAAIQLKALGASDSEDPKTRKVMALLERKGWLGSSHPLSDLAEDRAEAVLWYKKSAEHGNAWAQYQLGFRYEIGSSGLTQDAAEAARWYRKAAEQGNAWTQDVRCGSRFDEGRSHLK